MRNIRKLLLFAVGAIVALAVAPAVASAQSVEVYEETGGHCDDVVMVHHEPVGDPDCSVHAETEENTTADLFLHDGMVETLISECENEFEAAFDEDGHGWIYHQVLTPEAPSCGREPCDEAETSEEPHQNKAWEAQLSEAGPNTQEEENLRVTFCLYALDSEDEGFEGTPCTVDLHVNQVDHAFEVETPPHNPAGHGGAPCINLGGAVELEGHWLTSAPTEDHPGFEVHHLDDEAA
jgi:hypothetical protein